MPRRLAIPGQSTEPFHYSRIHQDNKPQIFFSAALDVAAFGLEGRERQGYFPSVERNQTRVFWFLLHVLFGMSHCVLLTRGHDWKQGMFSLVK